MTYPPWNPRYATDHKTPQYMQLKNECCIGAQDKILLIASSLRFPSVLKAFREMEHRIIMITYVVWKITPTVTVLIASRAD